MLKKRHFFLIKFLRKFLTLKILNFIQSTAAQHTHEKHDIAVDAKKKSKRRETDMHKMFKYANDDNR